MYALGACLYTFVYGRIPFSAPTVMKLFEVVQSTPLSFPNGIPASDSLKDLLSGMLAKVGPAAPSAAAWTGTPGMQFAHTATLGSFGLD